MHHCENMLIRCMDFRLNQLFSEFVKNELDNSYDLISIAGGAKAVVTDQTRGAILAMIELFQTKHGGKTVYLTAHLDCGAYNGKDSKIVDDLKRAGQIIKQHFPELEVKLYLARPADNDFVLESV